MAKTNLSRLHRIIPQLCVLGALSLLHLLALNGMMPSPERLTAQVENLFAKHGLPLVALCSFLENIVGVNAYFPGSIAILAGMALTAGNPTRALQMYFAIVIPAIAANQLSYWIGWRLRSRTDRLSISGAKKIWTWFLLTYWHPHLAATTAMASGAGYLKYRTFLRYFLVASLSWSIIWGLTIYHFGQELELRSNLVSLFYVYLVAWIVWDLIRPISRPSKKISPES